MSWDLQSIVVAVDGSDQSIRAAQRGVDLARLSGARVTVVTVVRTPEGWWGIDGEPPTPEALAAALTEGQRRVLARVMEQLDTEGVEVETDEELGDPASMIIAVCEDRDADLLVVGRRGAGLVERLIIGSVADRLAHDAPCPVMIVP